MSFGPCMCGDLCCSSCGPAQGNYRCPLCRAWATEGCPHVDDNGDIRPEFEAEVAAQAAAEAQFEAEFDAWLRRAESMLDQDDILDAAPTEPNQEDNQ